MSSVAIICSVMGLLLPWLDDPYQDLVVGPPGEAPYQVIQDAIEVAQDGDVILVLPGTYVSADGAAAAVVDFQGKALTLRACGGPLVTRIDGGGQIRGVVMGGTEAQQVARLEGFSIVQGRTAKADLDGDGNIAPWEYRHGGGLVAFEGTVELVDCQFVGNHATVHGGGAYIRNSTVTLTGCGFSDNRALDGEGGGLFQRFGEVMVTGGAFEDNRACFTGGGYYNRQGALMITDSIFRHNEAGVRGAGLYTKFVDPALVARSIFCGNVTSDGELSNIRGSWSNLGSVCLIESCTDEDENGFPDLCDPCVDESAEDSDGDGLCDAIDECPFYAGPCRLLPDGGRELLVFPGDSIQAVIDVAEPGDVITIAAGVYGEAINSRGKAITIRASSSGCDGATAVILDGSGLNAPVVTCVSQESNETRFEGLEFRNGLTDRGGGIFLSQASPVFEDCRIVENGSWAQGGGIWCSGGQPRFDGCLIAGNYTFGGGGGGYFEESAVVLRRTRFDSNQSSEFGGGAMVFDCDGASIVECLFISNTSTFAGGAGLGCHASGLTVSDSQFTGNDGGFNVGGGVLCIGGTLQLNYVQIDQNVGAIGGGLAIQDDALVSLLFTVICENTTPDLLSSNLFGSWVNLGGNVTSEICSDPGCPTDFNLNGVTEVDDLLLILDRWGPCLDPEDCVTDLDGSGATDCPDLLELLAAWGPCR